MSRSQPILANSRIYVAGHTGLLGSAIVRNLHASGHQDLITRTSAELDLTDQLEVRQFFSSENIEHVVLAAGKVGGIIANDTQPATFIRDNLAIQTNVIHEAWRSGVNHLMFVGSACIYPKNTPQPIREESLLEGQLEPTNAPYAVAKIAGIKMCESYNRQYGADFRSIMMTNLYGPGDNFHPTDSHVLPALIRKFHEAVEGGQTVVTLWGTGSPTRDFLFVDDAADACVHLMGVPAERWRSVAASPVAHVNVGSGEEIAIGALAEIIRDKSGFTGDIAFDATRPDGTPRRRLDVTRLDQLGWKSSTGIHEGVATTYDWYTSSNARSRGPSKATVSTP